MADQQAMSSEELAALNDWLKTKSSSDIGYYSDQNYRA